MNNFPPSTPGWTFQNNPADFNREQQGQNAHFPSSQNPIGTASTDGQPHHIASMDNAGRWLVAQNMSPPLSAPAPTMDGQAPALTKAQALQLDLLNEFRNALNDKLSIDDENKKDKQVVNRRMRNAKKFICYLDKKKVTVHAATYLIEIQTLKQKSDLRV